MSMWKVLIAAGKAVYQIFRLAWKHPLLGLGAAAATALLSRIAKRRAERLRERGRMFAAELWHQVGTTGLQVAAFLGLVAGVSQLLDEGFGAFWQSTGGVPLVAGGAPQFSALTILEPLVE